MAHEQLAGDKQQQIETRRPVAIVAMGCRYPGSGNIKEFWETLREGRDQVGAMPQERFAGWERFAGKIAALRGGFLEGMDMFDAAPFGISPREAAFLDPQQRLLLEVAWETLESAGVPIGEMAAMRTGVFVGEWLSDYEASMYQAAGDVELYMMTGGGRHSAAGRLSHVLNLRGPSMTVDTGCSSSLVAVHLACQSLRSGECDLALAGGVNVIIQPPIHMAFSQASMLSPEGRCKFGDAEANGFVRSEGCGMVALKLLERAVADGDPIVAVILASAVGHDGKTGLFMTPSGEAQAELQRQACAEAGIDPEQVKYVEAHGTGTSAGDPVELKALGSVYGAGRTTPLWVGSVKTNIGHTEAAAGVAGLIKTALAVRNRLIPPSLNFKTPSAAIPWSELPVAIATKAQEWGDSPAIAAVNSFGVAGTNAHVIVSEAGFVLANGDVPPEGRTTNGTYILPLSAHSDETLRAMAERWRDWLVNESALDDICHTAAVRRAHREYRMAIVGKDREEIVARLDSMLRGEVVEGLVGPERAQNSGGIAFVFSGQGPQWHAMGRGLMEAEPVFCEVIEQCDAWLRREAGWSLVEELSRGAEETQIDRTDITQPALFALQVGLARLWRSWGIVPEVMIGHSSGEVAAACAAGALSLEDGMRVILNRGLLQQTTAGKGRMLVTDLSLAEAEKLLAKTGGRVTVATVNSAHSLTLSGDPAKISTLEEQLDRAGRFARMLRVDIASHSPQMEPLMRELSGVVKSIAPKPTEVALISTVTGAQADGARLGPDYWALNIRQPVMFKKAMEEAIGRGVTTFVEISPHPVLAAAMGEVLAENGVAGAVLASLRRNVDEAATIRETLGRLYCRGRSIEWGAICRGRVVELPAYPWLRERCWFEDVISAGGGSFIARESKAGAPHANPLLGRMVAAADADGAVYFESELSARRLAVLNDHRVEGSMVLAGATIAGAMLEAANVAYGAGAHRLNGLRLIDAVAIPEEGAVDLQWELRPGSIGEVKCRLFARRGNEGWSARAEATIELEGSELANAGAWQGPEGEGESGEEFYATLAAAGLEYGPAYRRVERIWRGERGTVARLGVEKAGGGAVLIDAGLQLLLAGAADSFMLVSIGAVEIGSLESASEVWARARVTSRDADIIAGDVEWVDSEGETLALARDVRLQRLEREQAGVGAQRFYEVQWAPAETRVSENAPMNGRWIVVSDQGGIGAALVDELKKRGGECDDAIEGAAPRGVVQLATLDENDFGETRKRVCNGTLQIVQELAKREIQTRLVLVTRGAQPADAAALEGIHQSPLWGMGRAIQLELPGIGAKLVDLDPAASNEECARAILVELAAEDGETQLAWRGGKRLAARLAETSAPEKDLYLARPARRAMRLELTQPGSPENVELVPMKRRAPGRGEVEIRVSAGGLNFRDIWVALGMIGDETGLIGLECAGEIARVGEGVEEFRAGDRVVALAQGAFSSFVTVRSEFVAATPGSSRSLEDGTANDFATIPVAYLTAGYGLNELAKMKEGETVLIHAASGGVGLAAAALARMVGARVIATAGRASKRNYLKSIGIEHVFNSRTTEFAEQVRAATGGRGVDVVLNSLAGEFIPASLGALAEGGRFVEIGKTGIWSHEQMRAARPDVSYFPFDLLEVMRRDPALIGRMLRETVARIGEGRLATLPRRVYPIEAAIAALRQMSEARHIGKIVMSMEAGAGKARLDPDGAYLVTGGLGALGLESARWLIDRGARRIALVGRREASEDSREAIREMGRRGARVLAIAADVCVREEVARAIDETERELGGLRGVIHAAGVLADGVLVGQDAARFEAVIAPKADGAWHLHELTRERELDLFIMYSSTSALIGSPGQANHSAANAFLDCLAHLRRSQGLPATSINWGPWGRIGAAADPQRLENLAQMGLFAISPRRGIGALDRLLDWDPAQAAVARVDIGRLREHCAPLAAAHYFDRLATPAATQPTQSGASIREELARAAAGDRRSMIEDYLRGEVARVLRMSEARVDTRQPFKALGLDSLTGLELRNRLERGVGLKLPASLIWNYPTIGELGPHMLELMELNTAEPQKKIETEPSLEELLSEIESMSEEEAKRLLVKE